MKPKKIKKKRFTRVKTEKDSSFSNSIESSSLPFAVGDEVLACWQDGLYYLAVVKTIDVEKSKCQVTFEDDSIYWVLFKHIRTVASGSDEILCFVCGQSESTSQNDIVVCGGCFHGYHQMCHAPNIDAQSVDSEWTCRPCVFSKATKAGGAVKSGVDADALRRMKFTLPYNLNLLHWDAHHKCNSDEIYCYCAGPGLWYYKMLECQKCRQWFHEACLQCLDFPLLLGDRFYYFLCAVCNNGEEYLTRIQLKWSDIAALVLYNLYLKYDKRGFKSNDIKVFLRDSWDALQCGNLRDTLEEERMEKLTEVMKNQKRKFRCQSSGNGCITWSLIIRCAPFPTKANLIHEARRKSESEMTSSFVDWNGNYLQAATMEDNSTTLHREKVKHQIQASTSETQSSYQAPLFPSLSMFKYLLPNCGSRSNGSPESTSDYDHHSEHCPTTGDKRPRSRESADSIISEPIEKRLVTYVDRLSDSITSYAGTNGRLACGEDCRLLGRRLNRNGRVEYLVQWSGVTPDFF